MSRPRPDSPWTTGVFAMAPLCTLADSALTGLAVTLIATSTLLVSLSLSTLAATRWTALRSPGTGIMIAAAWVSVLDLLLHWLAPGLRDALGPYAALAVGSFALLIGLARNSDIGLEARRAALILPLVTGSLRELLGAGRLLGDLELITHEASAGWVVFPSAPLPLFALPPGAFALLALLLLAPPLVVDPRR